MSFADIHSGLQLREDSSSPGPEGLSQGGIETHLAYAEACLVNGQLSTAASHIQKLVQVSFHRFHIFGRPLQNIPVTPYLLQL